LEESKKPFEVINYLETAPSAIELAQIIELLKIKPIELVRKNEALWKENFKNKDFSDKELLNILAKHPKLIERPIVVNGNKATIGRPPERVMDII
jgi:arsenate reductase